MKRVLSSFLVGVLMLGLVAVSPAQAEAKATESAKTVQELVVILREHALNRDEKFTVDVSKMSEKTLDRIFEVGDLFDSVLSMLDDPETSDDADYLVGTLNLPAVNEDYIQMDEKGNLKFHLAYYETLPETEYVNQRVREILDSEIGIASMTNYEIVKAVHDYVCKLITYSNTEKDSESSMYGALKNRRALCNAYSLCMYKLLVEAGIPCKFVSGLAAGNTPKDAHAWNIVALGDRWYCMDTTWDDSDESNVSYDFFLKGTEDFDDANDEGPHMLEESYAKGDFAKAFPLAKTAFDPETMDDTNNSVTIGGNAGAIVDPATKYKWKDIVEGTWPESGKFTVKKGKKAYLQLYIAKGMDKKIKKVTYKITTGKNRVKSVKNYGICEDEGYIFTDLEFKGKKKGKVNVKITLKLSNGQSLSYTFKGKVK